LGIIIKNLINQKRGPLERGMAPNFPFLKNIHKSMGIKENEGKNNKNVCF
jgi:hypothetical protein